MIKLRKKMHCRFLVKLPHPWKVPHSAKCTQFNAPMVRREPSSLSMERDYGEKYGVMWSWLTISIPSKEPFFRTNRKLPDWVPTLRRKNLLIPLWGKKYTIVMVSSYLSKYKKKPSRVGEWKMPIALMPFPVLPSPVTACKKCFIKVLKKLKSEKIFRTI